MDDPLTVSDAAREIGARPKDISTLFYTRDIDDARVPIIGGRRLIPRSMLPVIAMKLRRKGRVVNKPGGVN